MREKNVDFSKFMLFFMGTIAFSLKLKQSKDKFDYIWSDNNIYSADFGTYKYPVYHFVFDYIINHSVDYSEIDLAVSSINNQIAKTIVDKELNMIYSFSDESEEEVVVALNTIKNRLELTKNIPSSEYLRLCNYLIYLKDIIGHENEIDVCKQLMLDDDNCEIDEWDYFDLYPNGGIQFASQERVDEFIAFKKEIQRKKEKKDSPKENFDYNPNSIDKLEELSKSNYYYNNKTFINLFDLDKFVIMVGKCNSKSLHRLRKLFLSTYRVVNIKETLSNEKDNLIELKEKLKNLIQKVIFKDKIQKYQINLFVNNLEDIIERL